MKKKILLSLAALALLLSVGCGKAEEDSAQFPTAVKIAEGESEEDRTALPEMRLQRIHPERKIPREPFRGRAAEAGRTGRFAIPGRAERRTGGIPVFGSV